MVARKGEVQGCLKETTMVDQEIGWIAAIIIGGIAGWLAEQFMESNMGLLMMSCSASSEPRLPAPFSASWHSLRRMDRLPHCGIHGRVFVDLDRPRGTAPHSVRTRAAEPGILGRTAVSPY